MALIILTKGNHSSLEYSEPLVYDLSGIGGGSIFTTEEYDRGDLYISSMRLDIVSSDPTFSINAKMNCRPNTSISKQSTGETVISTNAAKSGAWYSDDLKHQNFFRYISFSFNLASGAITSATGTLYLRWRKS